MTCYILKRVKPQNAISKQGAQDAQRNKGIKARADDRVIQGNLPLRWGLIRTIELTFGSTRKGTQEGKNTKQKNQLAINLAVFNKSISYKSSHVSSDAKSYNTQNFHNNSVYCFLTLF